MEKSLDGDFPELASPGFRDFGRPDDVVGHVTGRDLGADGVDDKVLQCIVKVAAFSAAAPAPKNVAPAGDELEVSSHAIVGG